MRYIEGSKAALEKLAARIDKKLGYPREEITEDVGGGLHVPADHPARRTEAWAELKKHHALELWRLEVGGIEAVVAEIKGESVDEVASLPAPDKSGKKWDQPLVAKKEER